MTAPIRAAAFLVPINTVFLAELTPYPESFPNNGNMRDDVPHCDPKIAAYPTRFTDGVIAIGALLHLLVAIIFVVSLLSAKQVLADSDTHLCKANNLVESLGREAPEKLAQARREAALIENGRSRFWRISRPGIADSYLFGTMHSPDPRVLAFPNDAKKAFQRSDIVLIENIEALEPGNMAQAIVALRDQTLLANGETLPELIPDVNADRLRDAVEARDMPWQVARLLQPWLVAATISAPICDHRARKSGAIVLDAALARNALDQGKQLIGLETIEEQFAAVSGIPRQFHIAALRDALTLGPIIDDVMETTKYLYLKGEIGLILPLIRQVSPNTYSGKGYSEFRKLLLTERNKTMAKRAEPHLDRGNAFIAVGALHLPGDDGLVSLLRARGFSVSQFTP